MRSLSPLSLRTGEGIVIDIGTGDGRFVSAMAKRAPNKFFIGIDANVKPLEKPSMKATRKPNKGGLPNVMFVQAAVEALPEEFTGVADEIHIHFPWGSLLRAIAIGDPDILTSLRRIAAPNCLLEIIIGIDPERDISELERLGLPDLTSNYLNTNLPSKYEAAGFKYVESGQMDNYAWSKIETSWAQRLRGSTTRVIQFLIFRAG